MSGDPPMNRRNFLRGRVLGEWLATVGERIAECIPQLPDGTGEAQALPSERYRKSFPVLRPPGAIEEEAFLAGCTRCNACIEACPFDAIVHAPTRFRRAAGTPMIDPIRQPCWMCEDTPCIPVCEPMVLRRELPLKMATVRVDVTTCLAHQSSFCTVCSEQCPVDGAISVLHGKPLIHEEACTGCGVCQHVCPAPSNAILLMPVAERPLFGVVRQSDMSPDGSGHA